MPLPAVDGGKTLLDEISGSGCALANGLGGGLTGRVGDGDDGRGTAVDGDLHARPPLAGELDRASREPIGGDALALEEAGVADRQPMAVDRGEQTVAGHRLEGVGRRGSETARRGGLDDGLGDRVLAVALG